MSAEPLLAAIYAAFLISAAVPLEWLSAHTHRRALRYRTAGFAYDADQDRWQCPEGEHLGPTSSTTSSGSSGTAHARTWATPAWASPAARTRPTAARAA